MKKIYRSKAGTVLQALPNMPLSAKQKKLIGAIVILAILGGVGYVLYWQLSPSSSPKAPAPPAPAPKGESTEEKKVAAARRSGFIRKQQNETLTATSGNIVMRSDAPVSTAATLVSSSGILASAGNIQNIVGQRSIPRSV